MFWVGMSPRQATDANTFDFNDMLTAGAACNPLVQSKDKPSGRMVP